MNTELDKELELLWVQRIGKFAKIRCKTLNGKDILLFGVISNVLNGKLILYNFKNPKIETDILISDILSADISEVRK